MTVQAIPRFEEAACFLCGGKYDRVLCRKRWHSSERHFTIVQCRRCGLVRMNPRRCPEDTKRNYEQVDSVGVFEEKGAGRTTGHRLLLEELERVLGRQGRLLDMGCATGQFLLAARDRGWQVVGVELTPACVGYCRDMHKLEVWQGDVLSPSVDGQRFDVISLLYVLEHVPDPLLALRAAYRYLQPGGILLAVVPNVDYIRTRIHRFRGTLHQSREMDPGHYTYFTRETLLRTARLAGLAPLKIDAGFAGSFLLGRDRVEPVKAMRSIAGLIHRFSDTLGIGSDLRLWAVQPKESR